MINSIELSISNRRRPLKSAAGAVGKTGVTADRDKIEFRLFNSSSIFNITFREELFSLLKQNQTMHSCPGFMALVT